MNWKRLLIDLVLEVDYKLRQYELRSPIVKRRSPDTIVLTKVDVDGRALSERVFEVLRHRPA